MTLACIALYRVLLYPIVLYVCVFLSNPSVFPCEMAFDRPMMAPRSGQHWLKSAQVHPKTTQERPVKFRKKTFQNYCVFTARVGRHATGLERERRDDDYLRRGLANEKW